ncbi:respiration factor rsf1 [Parelaphostrongylus tenuis]|uniref:Respiration factor rsf1 n=1 Tax=Parelaphostrongylus tenuis TaxID=148309 RepID=A0AAD5WMR7_PARTN|nr:respiration factor rsf1 [Parelaphostrongylus tenuis]
MSIVGKLKILRTLCDSQLDHNVRLKKRIPTALRALDMKDLVTGVDKCGLANYRQIDSVYDLRLILLNRTMKAATHGHCDLLDLENLIAKLKSGDLGYVKNPNDKREFKKAFNNDGENIANMVTKKGTYVDMFLDETAIKNMRAAMVKEKEERRNRRARSLYFTDVHHPKGERRVLPHRSASKRPKLTSVNM